MLPYSNLKIEHQNPGAANKLILPVHVICNTPDEEIYGNIRANSSKIGSWLKSVPEHDGIAILCGSGPSLGDFLEEIKAKQDHGGKVFAMNGSAQFLFDNGIIPDYQVIIDAREQTAELIGPAKTHLFASQVHPVCFDRVPNAVLWHLQVGNIEREFPYYEDEYVLIGGAASVGNTTTCLAFALGYRNLHVYGYDSSHRGGKGHAFHQKMNDGDPCCHVTFNGKEFIASLTMKLQAEKFQETARALRESGCKIEVYGDGLLPEIYRHPKVFLSEQEKYKKMWEQMEYRAYSPGEHLVDRFMELMDPMSFYRIIDFGCGTGRASVKLREASLCEVVQVDLTDNSRDETAKDFIFYQCDITDRIPVFGDYGFCTDVMEHIPSEEVNKAIRNIMNSAPKTFFQISTVPDVMGEAIGQDLHLTVRPHEWWKTKFKSFGYCVIHDQDLGESSIFVVENKI